MKQALVYVKKHLLYIVGGILGAVGGFLYWFYVGCQSGTCPITSSPWMSTIWGALIGSLFLSLFKKNKEV